jgi:hypothetical protein
MTACEAFTMDIEPFRTMLAAVAQSRDADDWVGNPGWNAITTRTG